MVEQFEEAKYYELNSWLEDWPVVHALGLNNPEQHLRSLNLSTHRGDPHHCSHWHGVFFM